MKEIDIPLETDGHIRFARGNLNSTEDTQQRVKGRERDDRAQDIVAVAGEDHHTWRKQLSEACQQKIWIIKQLASRIPVAISSHCAWLPQNGEIALVHGGGGKQMVAALASS